MTQQPEVSEFSGTNCLLMLASPTNLLPRQLQKVKESNCDRLVRTVIMIEVRAAGLQLLKEGDGIFWSVFDAVLFQRGQDDGLNLN